MGGKWRAKDFFILTAIGLAGLVFEIIQYNDAVAMWTEHCSDALSYDQLSQECKDFSDDMDWVLYELIAISILTVFSLIMGFLKIGGESSRGDGEGFGVIKTFAVVTFLTLIFLFIYAFVIRSQA